MTHPRPIRRDNYSPSSETHRIEFESGMNAKRGRDYQEKKGSLDVTSEQEVLPDDYDSELSKDPEYQKFIDEVNDLPF